MKIAGSIRDKIASCPTFSKQLDSLYRFSARFRSYGLPILVSLAILSGLLLPLNLLAIQPFHHDEALYATWALKVISGDDPWLAQTPVDKPPLFLYMLAGAMQLVGVTETAARLPSLLATAATVFFTFLLGRKLYGNNIALLSAWLVALSPFTLLFAPTAFTDPMLAALVLAGCLAAAHTRPMPAGICLALATATKQQGLFFAPLAVGLLLLSLFYFPFRLSSSTLYALRFTFYFILSLCLTLLPFLIWDFSRSQPSAFLEESLKNYGGLTTDFGGFSGRWLGFMHLLRYGTASAHLNFIFLIGCPALLLYGLWLKVRNWRSVMGNWHSMRQVEVDWLLFGFSLFFLLLHALLSFQVWDRYLLGLMPLLALLLARVLLLPWSILQSYWNGFASQKQFTLLSAGYGLALVFFLAFSLAKPVQDAANARYPIGSHSQALQGIGQIVAYLQGHAGADHTLYHHWLGTHWRFYLWGYPYDLQYWATPEELVSKARPGHFIAYPAWRSETEIRLALFKTGLGLHELVRAYRGDGGPSIILYEIRPLQ